MGNAIPNAHETTIKSEAKKCETLSTCEVTLSDEILDIVKPTIHDAHDTSEASKASIPIGRDKDEGVKLQDTEEKSPDRLAATFNESNPEDFFYSNSSILDGSLESNLSFCTVPSSLESIAVLRYIDELVDGNLVTFYEIGNPHASKCITRKRYAQFRKFYEEIKSRSPEVAEFKFPNKSVFHSMATHTKERRKSGFSEFLQLVYHIDSLHIPLLDFLGVDYVVESNQVLIANGLSLEERTTGRRRRNSRSYTASRVLRRVRQGYTTAIGGSFITAEAMVQGVKVGKSYVPIRVPDGPTAGLETFVENFPLLLESSHSNLKELYTRIKLSFLSRSVWDPQERVVAELKPPRPIRLYVIGDSLVCGVGCDNDIGPNLPGVIAKCLSLIYHADCNW